MHKSLKKNPVWLMVGVSLHYSFGSDDPYAFSKSNNSLEPSPSFSIGLTTSCSTSSSLLEGFHFLHLVQLIFS